ncbi:MAG: plasmid mobilization protein [Oscillospiraceae bacterium]
MANRERNIKVNFYISENEKKIIKEKMKLANINNFSLYSRKILINGYIIKRDFSELKILCNHLSHIGRNINQIAKKANITNSVCKDDFSNLQKDFLKIKKIISERLVKLIKEEI